MSPARFSDLTLILTERCDLRCDYCYVPKQRRDLPLDLALQATDWLLDQVPAGQSPSLSFFGGEPLLAEETLLAVIARARARRPDGVRFMAPTNGRLLDPRRLTGLRAAGLELALSIDSGLPDETPLPAGGKSLQALRPMLAELRELAPIVRMTVTPQNTGELFESVVGLFAAGFRRIMHQPALEQPWLADALERWRSEHQKLVEWLVDRYAARQPIPELITLEGIVGRLSGAPARPCGAGVTTAALDVEGRLFACYRSAFDPHADRLVLGDLRRGWLNEPLLAAYARLDPSRALPEEGSCKRCEAREGCTIYCPAVGHVLCGDLRAVPADACRLLRAQVELCRGAMERMRRADQSRRRSVGAHVAAAALALGLSSASAACDESRPVHPGLCDAGGQYERGAVPDSTLPGLCDAPHYRAEGPGLCPGKTDLQRDKPAPGLCPPPRPDGLIGPGLCPVKVDLPGPGLCPPPLPDGTIGPGLCPVILPDARPGEKPVPPPGLCAPGLCPRPGLC